MHTTVYTSLRVLTAHGPLKEICWTMWNGTHIVIIWFLSVYLWSVICHCIYFLYLYHSALLLFIDTNATCFRVLVGRSNDPGLCVQVKITAWTLKQRSTRRIRTTLTAWQIRCPEQGKRQERKTSFRFCEDSAPTSIPCSDVRIFILQLLYFVITLLYPSDVIFV
jgi:hypothetical protein